MQNAVVARLRVPNVGAIFTLLTDEVFGKLLRLFFLNLSFCLQKLHTLSVDRMVAAVPRA